MFNWLIVVDWTSHIAIMIAVKGCILPLAECITALITEGLVALSFLVYFFMHRNDARWIERVVLLQKLFFVFFLALFAVVLIMYSLTPNRYCDASIETNNCVSYFRLMNWAMFLSALFVPIWVWCLKRMDEFSKDQAKTEVTEPLI